VRHIMWNFKIFSHVRSVFINMYQDGRQSLSACELHYLTFISVVSL
jgi:hypothetical protein